MLRNADTGLSKSVRTLYKFVNLSIRENQTLYVLLTRVKNALLGSRQSYARFVKMRDMKVCSEIPYVKPYEATHNFIGLVK